MSITAEYVDGVFRPMEEVKDAKPGRLYRVFSDDELRALTEQMSWLRAAENSFEFWNNKEDEIYDTL